MRLPKPQISVEMFRRNLQSLVWKRHVGAVIYGAPTWRPKNSAYFGSIVLSARKPLQRS